MDTIGIIKQIELAPDLWGVFLAVVGIMAVYIVGMSLYIFWGIKKQIRDIITKFEALEKEIVKLYATYRVLEAFKDVTNISFKDLKREVSEINKFLRSRIK